jgi:EAL domain-containing protein (putative c-di-GMP-specific phosphodiesterase class I)
MGVRTSLDDFGTGDSNLGRLRGLRFDEVKIDGSFVRDVARSSVDRDIVDSVTRLAHRLGSVVVAECVETQPCLDAVAELGVDRAQGFHLHRPAAAQDLPPAAEPGFSLRAAPP